MMRFNKSVMNLEGTENLHVDLLEELTRIGISLLVYMREERLELES